MGTAHPGIELRLLGPLTVLRGGTPLRLPASRKARALLAYLSLSPHAVARSALCELLWESPDDPRGELRWCLSKLRKVIDSDGQARLVARDDGLQLDLAGCFVDAIEVSQAVAAGLGAMALEELRRHGALFRGDLLEGLELERNAAFSAWLTAQRRRFRGARVALLEQLASRAPDAETLGYLEQWLELSPFDRGAHERLLSALATQGRLREAEQHLATSVRLFEAEGLDAGPLVHAWRTLRSLDVAETTQAVEVLPEAARAQEPARRASIAVMPFMDRSPAAALPGNAAGALAYDVIARLAKLRSLFVIAQGTVFTLHARGLGAEDVGRLLNVDYVVGGSLERRGEDLRVTAELSEARSARIVWTEAFHEKASDALAMLERIGNRIVASVAAEIEMLERNRAILRPPSSLDAWEAHHRGLWHMYRFNEADNARARHFFELALRLDPTFSRAFAGLSFTHFQGAFQGWADRAGETERAYRCAAQSLLADDRDPGAHWAMGRALWLMDRHQESVAELSQAIELSPNFALAHYNLSFVHATGGDPQAAIVSADYSRDLSPYDPMLFGMLGVRSMALMRLGRYAEAAQWGVKAAARPNAFPHIHAIAAYSLALAGELDEARSYAQTVQRVVPGYGLADFLRAFRFGREGQTLFRDAARRIGMG